MPIHASHTYICAHPGRLSLYLHRHPSASPSSLPWLLIFKSFVYFAYTCPEKRAMKSDLFISMVSCWSEALS